MTFFCKSCGEYKNSNIKYWDNFYNSYICYNCKNDNNDNYHKSSYDKRKEAIKKIEDWYKKVYLKRVNAANKIGNWYKSRYLRKNVIKWKKELDDLEERFLNLRNQDISEMNEIEGLERIRYEQNIKSRIEDLYFKIYGRDYDEDMLRRNRDFEEVIELANENEIDFNDVEDYEKDIDVIKSGIKKIIFNGNEYKMDIFKYKGKNKECRDKWVLYWSKKDNGIGIKYVEYNPNKRVVIKDDNGEYVKPEFKERNIFYLEVLDYPKEFNTEAKFDINYMWDSVLRNYKKTFTKEEVNEHDDVMCKFDWDPSINYYPNNYGGNINMIY